MSCELKVVASLNGHKDEVKGLKAVRVNGNELLYSGSRDKKVFAWDLHSKVEESDYARINKLYDNGHRRRINGIDVSKDGAMLVSVGSDMIGRIWNTKNKMSIELKGHSKDVLCVSINSNDTKIATGSVDKTMNIYNTRGELITSITKDMARMHRGWINCVAFHPLDESVLASGSSDGTVKIWNLEMQEHTHTYLGGVYVDYEKAEEAKTQVHDYDESKSVTAMAYSLDGSLLAYGDKSGKAYLVKPNTQEQMCSIDVTVPIRSIAVGETDAVIGLGTDESVIIWDTISSKVVASYDLCEIMNGVKCLSLVFSGRTLYCGLSNGTIVELEFRKLD
ncbi:WD40 domain-containing protein [Ordospora colligata]|uniref:WD40 domain-containing protein n=1 Tax=Ordospora colligata OC4 TaxID=1354746 RepID=A0A0B2UIL0_9MICR|nr:WD40 domain-containing protein [Ordospora colligata OC4]KHN69183.1 WD40 domain-containing protein [Ordospora colligata OC4]TBU14461.1 WD40 domain-containing protein [Ordospora colligata]TBU14638.1 WD40 domain-containing protein [Ordospora colligata]TBU18023.1 WD40 domain-containing protein [Ordospora colligata]